MPMVTFFCPFFNALPARAVPAIMRPAFAVAEAEHSNLLLGRL